MVPRCHGSTLVPRNTTTHSQFNGHSAGSFGSDSYEYDDGYRAIFSSTRRYCDWPNVFILWFIRSRCLWWFLEKKNSDFHEISWNSCEISLLNFQRGRSNCHTENLSPRIARSWFQISSPNVAIGQKWSLHDIQLSRKFKMAACEGLHSRSAFYFYRQIPWCPPITVHWTENPGHTKRYRFCSRFQSADNDDMIVPHTRTVRYGPQNFRVVAPQIWNRLPSYLENINILLVVNSLSRHLRIGSLCKPTHRRRLWKLCLSGVLQMLELIDWLTNYSVTTTNIIKQTLESIPPWDRCPSESKG